MRDSNKLDAAKSELAKLRQSHLEDVRDATFMGWTPETLEKFEEREDQIADLVRQLAGLEPRPQAHIESVAVVIGYFTSRR